LVLQKEANMLHKVPMFAKLGPSKTKLLAFTSELLSYEDQEVLFRVGEAADDTYVVMEGAVEFYADTEHGEVAVGTLGVNELVGELGVITNSPRSATVRAKGATKALRVKGEFFLRLVTEHSDVSLDVMRQISEKLQRTHRYVAMLESKLQQDAE